MVKQLSPYKINKIGLVEKRKDEKLEVQCVVEFSPRTYNYYVTRPCTCQTLPDFTSSGPTL